MYPFWLDFDEDIHEFISCYYQKIFFTIFNNIFGFILNGKFVFKKHIIIKNSYLIRYITLLTFSWSILNLAIYFGSKINISANISSLLIIPLITINSYFI